MHVFAGVRTQLAEKEESEELTVFCLEIKTPACCRHHVLVDVVLHDGRLVAASRSRLFADARRAPGAAQHEPGHHLQRARARTDDGLHKNLQVQRQLAPAGSFRLVFAVCV
jgi:hypothetical protein